MSRLIDADLLKENCKCTGKFEDNFCCVDLITLAKVIDAQPTAYDVDRVVEQLEEKSELARKKCTIYPVHNPLYDRYDTQYQELKSCLEIAKGGGLNE